MKAISKLPPIEPETAKLVPKKSGAGNPAGALDVTATNCAMPWNEDWVAKRLFCGASFDGSTTSSLASSFRRKT